MSNINFPTSKVNNVYFFSFICALYLAVVNNFTFFTAANIAGKHNYVFNIALFFSLTLLFFIAFLVVANFKPIFKPLVITILVLASSISYFMDNFGVVVNVDMIQNVMETDVDEAFELITPGLLLRLGFLGVLPAVWVYKTEIHHQPLINDLLRRLLVFGGTLLVLTAIIFFNYKTFSFVLRNHHELRYLVNPNYPIYSLVKYVKSSIKPQLVVRELGLDAKQIMTWQERGKKSLLVLVVGETARAENFSLNGYEKNTNPRLSNENIINFPNTHSCGTATAASLPCMFSNLKQSGYSDSEVKQNENLLDVLKHAGVNVVWLDNNSGCKGVCQRVTTINLESLKIPKLCNDEECYDEILLQELNKVTANLPDNSVVVLHQKGSHGPAYYKRHPERFKAFLPECTRNEVQDCSEAEIKNAYDNTILYTDYFLAEVIKSLKSKASSYNTAMIYMSDHGESLGENGIFLHGLPYAFAPEQQTHIPFILWLSDSSKDSFHLQPECLKEHGNEAYSHDNLFHSVLGLLEIKTHVYESTYDIFASCKSSAV